MRVIEDAWKAVAEMEQRVHDKAPLEMGRFMARYEKCAAWGLHKKH